MLFRVGGKLSGTRIKLHCSLSLNPRFYKTGFLLLCEINVCLALNIFRFILSYDCNFKCWYIPETAKFDVVTSKSGVVLTGALVNKLLQACRCRVKANFHSGKLSVDWNGQEKFSLSCELWVGTNDFNTKKNFLVRSNPRIIFLSGD
jgi:hypothetical protein